MGNVLMDGQLLLYGIVGIDFDGLDVISALAKVGRATPVDVRINSPGGFVDDGTAIFNAIAAHQGKVTVYVDGMAASAASVVAMAGDDRVMRIGSMMMIHDPAGLTIGNVADHEKQLEALNAYADSMASIYAEKSGRTLEECRADMREEIWLTAQAAVDLGYATKVDGGEAVDPSPYDYTAYSKAPARLVALSNERAWNALPRIQAALSAALTAKENPMPISEADHKAAVDAAVAAKATELEAKHQTALQEAQASADSKAKAERDRVAAIMDSEEAKGRETQARHIAFKTSMSPDEAKAILASGVKVEAAKPEKKDGFSAAMDKTKNPDVGPDADGGEETAEQVAAQIVALHRGMNGFKAAG